MARGKTSLGTQELDATALQRAFKDALGGRAAVLDDMLTRYGGLPGRANSKLAAAFGAEVSAQKANALPLLTRLANDDADADMQRVFLPVAAAFGFCAYLTANHPRKNSEIEAAWTAIQRLVADHRVPVRLGAIDALVALCAHPGYADMLIARAQSWLSDEEDRELRFAAGSAVLSVLAHAAVVSSLRDHEAMLEHVSGVIELIADAPRSAERSDARRRALRVLPDALCTIMSRMARVSGERAIAWLSHECEQASQLQVREALSDTIVRLQKDPQGVGRAATERLRKTLEASAAPLRDGVFLRPGTGRGKSTRKIR